MGNNRTLGNVSFNAGTFAPKKYDKITHTYDYPAVGQTTIRFFAVDVFLAAVVITYDGEGRETQSQLYDTDV